MGGRGEAHAFGSGLTLRERCVNAANVACRLRERSVQASCRPPSRGERVGRGDGAVGEG